MRLIVRRADGMSREQAIFSRSCPSPAALRSSSGHGKVSSDFGTFGAIKHMADAIENGAKKEIEPHLEKFERFEKQAKEPAWVFPLRKAGIARFAELGFPTVHDENWRFTNVAPITRLPFNPVFQALPDGLTREALAKMTFG